MDVCLLDKRESFKEKHQRPLTCCAEITSMVSSVSSLHYVRQNNMETKNKKTIKVIDNQTGQELTLEVNNSKLYLFHT